VVTVQGVARDVPLILQEMAREIVQRRLGGASAEELADLRAEYDKLRQEL
jgi:hypothetical protein